MIFRWGHKMLNRITHLKSRNKSPEWISRDWLVWWELIRWRMNKVIWRLLIWFLEVQTNIATKGVKINKIMKVFVWTCRSGLLSPEKWHQRQWNKWFIHIWLMNAFIWTDRIRWPCTSSLKLHQFLSWAHEFTGNASLCEGAGAQWEYEEHEIAC